MNRSHDNSAQSQKEKYSAAYFTGRELIEKCYCAQQMTFTMGFDPVVFH